MKIENSDTPSAVKFQRDLIALIPYLRVFSRSLCRSPALGEDMAQEALAKAWRSRARFEPGTNLRAWLFTILRNEYFSLRRRAWRESNLDEAKAARIAAPHDAQLWSLELSDTVHAMHELPDHQREALVLVAAGGISYEDAAAICDVPVGTVKSRVARGRTALMNKLSGCEKIVRSKAVRPAGAMDDILAQLSALTPAGAPCAAYA
jgi:RNA polymerase sigma-70 factor (ECF subfamily)